MNGRCENCYFWFGAGMVGDCRRYPPRLVRGMLPAEYWTGPAERAVWPETEAHQVCGEFADGSPEFPA